MRSSPRVPLFYSRQYLKVSKIIYKGVIEGLRGENMVSKRVSGIEPSATLAVSAKAKAMKKAGEDVVGFGAGEPDFDTPKHIKEAAKKAIDEGFTKYTPAHGIPELRQAVADKIKKDSGVEYSADDIVISNGGKHTLANIMLAMLDDGDEVVLPVPYWVSYVEQVKLAGGNVAFADTEELKIKADLIADKITDKTKMIILNSPSNPSGMMASKAEIKKIADLAATNKIFVVSDEVYEKFTYGDEEQVSIASLGEEIKKLTIECKEDLNEAVEDIKATTRALEIEFGKGDIECSPNLKIKAEF